MILAEALALADLESGRTYRCQVKEFDVELRVLDEKAPSVQATKADSLFEFMEPFKVEECDLVWDDLYEPEDEMDLPDTPHIATDVNNK